MDGVVKGRFLREIGERVRRIRGEIEGLLKTFLEFLNALSKGIKDYSVFVDKIEKLTIFLRFYHSSLLDKERGVLEDLDGYSDRIDEVLKELRSLDIKGDVAFLLRKSKEIKSRLNNLKKYMQVERNLRKKLLVLKKKKISFEEIKELEGVLDMIRFILREMYGRFESSLRIGEDIAKEIYVSYKEADGILSKSSGYKGMDGRKLWNVISELEDWLKKGRRNLRKLLRRTRESFRKVISQNLLKKDPLGYGGIFKRILEEYEKFSEEVREKISKDLEVGKEKGVFWCSIKEFEERIISDMEMIRDYIRTFSSFLDRIKLEEVTEERLTDLKDLLTGLSRFEAFERVDGLLKMIKGYKGMMLSLVWKAFEEMKYEINEDILFFGRFVKEYRKKRLEKEYLELMKNELSAEVSNLELYYKDWMKRTRGCINIISKEAKRVERVFEREYREIIEPFFISFEKLLSSLRKISLETDALKAYIDRRLKKRMISERRIKRRLDAFFKRLSLIMDELDVVSLEIDGLNIFIPDVERMDREILDELEKVKISGYCGRYWTKYNKILGTYLKRTKEILKEMYRKAIEITSLLSSLKSRLKPE